MIGFAQGTLSNMFSRGTNPSYEMILKISEKFPNYSMDWLITGEGEIYKNNIAKGNNIDPKCDRGMIENAISSVDQDFIPLQGGICPPKSMGVDDEEDMDYPQILDGLKRKNEYLETRIKDLEGINEMQEKIIKSMELLINTITKTS